MELFTTNDGITLNYRTSGEGNAIVMIHTAFDNLTVFNEIEKKLNTNHQVVLIDLRGHGYSDKPNNLHFKTYAEDVKALLDYLYIEQCAFIGHEMGASIAVSIAAEFPTLATSLTLVNPTMLNDMNPAERLYRKYANKIRNWDEEKQQKFLDNHLYYSKRKVKKFLKQLDNTNGIATKNELSAVKQSFNNNNISYYLGKVNSPTLIIVGQHGERTSVVEAKEFGDYIGDVKFEVFKESGLYPFVEEKSRFIELSKNFIKEHETRVTN
ncbi:alpha/beta hydrolase [Staphylococcus succinus]|uniref:alpha/beta fold hydrolase n=1 Tax=Staphylococcus succinus TaxID=61015 RepID=UPI000C3225CD|nr:alpha/beta hydrolase [Staphylococcus succinus]MEB7462215.1 alpha/beta hydrolase [Staphylococcus succinus]PKI22465.1 alpha/beta hydrolase [Staphylococcus succinus]PTJ85316.1 alpha/beta hydrolase [Staphylococcus succinus]